MKDWEKEPVTIIESGDGVWLRDVEGRRYLGNVNTRELHDLQKITPMCRRNSGS